MSEENVEIVRNAFAAFERGDIEALLRMADEDIVITQPDVPGIPAQLHGHRGVVEAFAVWPELWEDFRVEILSIAAAPGGKVIATVRNHGRGKGSGIEVEMDFIFVITIRDAKATEWQLFVLPAQEDEALKAAGLSE